MRRRTGRAVAMPIALVAITVVLCLVGLGCTCSSDDEQTTTTQQTTTTLSAAEGATSTTAGPTTTIEPTTTTKKRTASAPKTTATTQAPVATTTTEAAPWATRYNLVWDGSNGKPPGEQAFVYTGLGTVSVSSGGVLSGNLTASVNWEEGLGVYKSATINAAISGSFTPGGDVTMSGNWSDANGSWTFSAAGSDFVDPLSGVHYSQGSFTLTGPFIGSLSGGFQLKP